MADRSAINRANARASTGPKSKVGKARAAGNARLHGLSVPAVLDPSLAEEIKELARKIAGSNASSDRLELAMTIAAAQVDLLRVRQVRHQMLSFVLNDPDYQTPTKAILRRQWLARHAAPPADAGDIRPRDMINGICDPSRFVQILGDLSFRLHTLDRYERRALSRRKRAVRAFDSFQRNTGAERQIDRS